MTTATELTLSIPDTTEMEARQVELVELAITLKVTDQSSLEAAAEFRKDIKRRIGVVDDFLGEFVKRAHAAHKSAVAAKNKLRNPLDQAYEILGVAMGKYVQGEERKRAAEEHRLRAIARKEEEDRRIADAEQLAKEDREEEAVAILDEPIVVATPAAKKVAAPNMSTRKTYTYEVVDLSKIPRGYMQTNATLIGQVVRAQHEQAEKIIPGIKVIVTTSVATR